MYARWGKGWASLIEIQWYNSLSRLIEWLRFVCSIVILWKITESGSTNWKKIPDSGDVLKLNLVMWNGLYIHICKFVFVLNTSIWNDPDYFSLVIVENKMYILTWCILCEIRLPAVGVMGNQKQIVLDFVTPHVDSVCRWKFLTSRILDTFL